MASVRLPRRVIFVRHGQTSGNSAGIIQGATDVPLNDHGRWQAAQTSSALRSLFVERLASSMYGGSCRSARQVVIASDLSRAMETAHAFADPLGLEVHGDARLRERGFGDWEGRRVEDLLRMYPEAVRGWLDNDGSELQFGVEPKPHAGERGARTVLEWARRCMPDTDLYVFSHGSAISQTINYLLGHRGTDPVDTFQGLLPMDNAFWAVMVPTPHRSGRMTWSLQDYNEGPAIARELDWNKDENTRKDNKEEA
ncbi:MAG: histidine phosphatase family protein [Aeriscardovia sp.]|nr:histidine phosphatase family protein [Aeriscardovia sp.]